MTAQESKRTNQDFGQRQQILMLWLASSALDSDVLGWSFYDGSTGAVTLPDADPPYADGVAALRDGWRLIQIAQLIPPVPGHEHDTSFLKHECVFERMV
jgi:hypothetical protein